jgi:hypothetical protein
MADVEKNTLELALNALIDIENDKLPSTKSLVALQQAVWGWLEPDREKSLLASKLFKQGTEIKKTIKRKSKTLEIDIKVQKGIDSGLNKTKSVENLAGEKKSGEVSGIWNKVTSRLDNDENETKRVAKLRRINAAIENLKKPKL